MSESRRRYDNLALNAYWVGVSFMWNSIHPIILPMLLLRFSEGTKNTLYGLITFLGLMIAMVVQPVSGALSDRTRHKLGRRRPWILAGTLLDVVCLAILVMARSYWGVAIGYVLLQISSNLAHGPGQGLIPDLISEDRRGAASGVKSLLDMVGIILAALVMGRLMGGFSPDPRVAIVVIVGILLTTMTITCLRVQEPSSVNAGRTPARSVQAHLRAIFSIDLSTHRDYARLLLSRFLVLFGAYSVQAFALYYFRDVHQAEDPARLIGDLMMALGLTILLTSYPAGLLSERWGRKRLSLLACAIGGVGIALLCFAQSVGDIRVLGCLIGLGMGIFASVNWAWATDLVPSAEAGKYLGLTNLATAGSAAASRLLGPVIDLVNRSWANAGYSVLFVVATVSTLLALVVTLGIPETRLVPHKQGALEQYDAAPPSP